MLPEAIELQVVTPQRHVLQENVQAIEIPGKEGYLGVLPGHAPLITELGIGILAYRKGGETRYLTVMQGYAEVLPDRVIVLAEISERAEEIDIEKVAGRAGAGAGGAGENQHGKRRLAGAEACRGTRSRADAGGRQARWAGWHRTSRLGAAQAARRLPSGARAESRPFSSHRIIGTMGTPDLK